MTATNILGTSKFLTVATYYDNKARISKIVKEHQLGGVDITTNSYNFVDEVVSTTRKHYKDGVQALTLKSSYKYDHVGRILTVGHSVNSQNEVTLVSNEYNEIGQLKKKSVGGDGSGANFHNVTEYGYNARGWLRSASSPYFSYGLRYDDPEQGAMAQYNGNISEQYWTRQGESGSKFFTYSYDRLNRLKDGNSASMREQVDYDAMGNITSLKRDNANAIVYAYIGNRLDSLKGGLSGRYTYDVNGNAKTTRMGMNLNYNHLNRPDSVWFGTMKVGYLYDGSGGKLRKIVSSGSTTTLRNYIEGIEYSKIGSASHTIERVATENGYLVNSGGSYVYHYFIEDNLGNVRAVLKRNGSNVEMVQKQDYYPFGKTKSILASASNRYLYNGKEKQDEIGDQLDYGARFYDPEIGRWNVVDPKASKMPAWSPYSFGFNNPIYYIDPDGQEPTPAEAARMAAHVYGDKKNGILTGGWQVSSRTFGLTGNDLNNTATGLRSLVYERVVNGKVTEYTYATAGTEASWKDVGADVKQPLGLSKQYTKAADNAKAISGELGETELTYVGHSLGGGEAALNALVTDRKAITFNAAGVGDITKFSEGTWKTPFKSESKIDAYILRTDPLNKLQNSSPIMPDVNGKRHYLWPTDLPSVYNGHSVDNMLKNYGVKKPEEYKKQ